MRIEPLRAWKAVLVLVLCTMAVPTSVGAQQAKATPQNPPILGGSAPRVTAAVFGVSNGTTYAGWPLIITLSAMHPQALARGVKVTPMVLASNSGPWPKA